METWLRIVSSAIALAAMVLIWNEAPIVDSPSDHEGSRVAYSDAQERPRAVETEAGPGDDREPGDAHDHAGVRPKEGPVTPGGDARSGAR